MRKIRFTALLPAFLLAACYTSEKEIYSIADGQLPLPAGLYQSAQGSAWDVSIRDGHYSVPSGISGSADVVLVPLAGRSRTYIVEKGESDGFSYSLLKVLSDGRGFALLKPDCEQAPDRAAAQSLSMIREKTCTFTTGASLTAAMRKLDDSSAKDRWVTYTRN